LKQPAWAMPLAGGSAALGLAAVLAGFYNIVDCTRWQKGPGECSTIVSESLRQMAVGGAALAGPMGGFFLYNKELERPDKLIAGGVQAVAAGAGRDLLDEAMGRAGIELNTLGDQGLIRQYAMDGWKPENIASTLGLSEEEVRRVLRR